MFFSVVCGNWELELILVSFTGTMDKSSRWSHSIEDYATKEGRILNVYVYAILFLKAKL